MSDRQSTVQRVYRMALAAYLFTLVLVIYAGTNDPTIDIKQLLTAWGAGVLAGGYLVLATVLRIPLRRPVIFFEVGLCLLGLFFLSAIFSEFRTISFLETSRFFSLFALYWLAAQLYQTPAQVLRLFTVFCVAVFFAALYAVMQATGLDPFPWNDTTSDTYTNLPSTYGNPNFAAHALILALIMIACLARGGARWMLCFVPLYLFHFHSTDQRAGWIALAGAAFLVAIGMLLVRRVRRPVSAVTIVMGLFALAGVTVLVAAMYLTHLRTGQLFPLDLSLLLRYQSYVSATKMLFDAPFLGHGPAVYGLAYVPYWTPFEQAWFAQELRMNAHVHNDLLELAIDGGLAAAGLYLAMLVLGMAYGLLMAARGTTSAQRRLGFTFAALFCAFGIDGLFGFNLRVPVTAALFFLMMGTLDGMWTHGQPAPAAPRDARLGTFLGVVFLFLLILGTGLETRAFTSQYHLRAGVEAQKGGDYDGAAAAYQRAADYAPWNATIPRRQGLLALDRNNITAALADFDRSHALNPYYVLNDLSIARANLMLAQQEAAPGGGGEAAAVARLNEARNHAESVLALVPDFADATEILGRIEAIAAIVNRDKAAHPDPAAQAKHWENARHYLNEAIDQGPENAGELYRMLMQVELGLNNTDGAESALLAAVQVAPEESRTWAIFMNYARQYKRFDRMRGALQERIDRLAVLEAISEGEEEQLATAYAWLAAVLQEGYENIEGAADAHASAVEFGPHRPELWDQFATFAATHGKRSDFDAALRQSCARVRERGGAPLVQLEVVDAILTDPAANLDQASRRLLASLRADPGDGELSIGATYGWSVQRLNEALDTLAAQGTAPCESFLNLGIAAATLNQLPLAQSRFEKARECLTDERRAALAVHWADTLVRLNQGDEALALLNEGEAQFPEDLEIRWAKARALLRMNRADEALLILNSLLKEPELAPEAKAQLEREIARATGGT